jgi:hypothetical protein
VKTHSHRILVMGVSGSGKSHIGHQLALILGATFIDGDDYHSPANVAKMASGTPLNDDDRSEWLGTLAALLAEYRARGESLVIACSGLKKRYRDRLRQGDPALQILYLGSYCLNGSKPGQGTSLKAIPCWPANWPTWNRPVKRRPSMPRSLYRPKRS